MRKSFVFGFMSILLLSAFAEGVEPLGVTNSPKKN